MASKQPNSEEYDRFTALVDRVVSVPKAVIQQRIEEHERQSKLNPARRGPKPKKPLPQDPKA
jgi:hypothetical protein